VLQLRFAARSDVGLVRSLNEDSGYAAPGLLAVADGMGGHAAGEVASAAVVRVLTTLGAPAVDGREDPEPLLRQAISQASDRLRDLVTERPELDGMGTTLTMVLQVGERVAIAQVGDSRGYLLREGVLERVTHDQTFVQTLIDQGRISVDEARTHPQRSLLLQAIDGRVDVEPVVVVRTLRAGDRYLLCSDGLSSFVTESTMRDVLEVGTPDEAADRLVDLALRTGAPDNVTCVVADVVDEPADAGEQASQVVGSAAEDRDRFGTVPVEDADAPDELVGDPATLDDGTERDGDGPDGHEHDDHEHDADEHGHDGGGHRRGRRFRLLLPFLVLLVAVAVAAFAGYRWTQSQYFVGVDDSGQVAIFRGVPQTVAGVDLSRVVEPSGIQATALPSYAQSQVSDTIGVSGVDEARRIVDQLRSQASACATTPSPEGCP
jgi:protein phosphatase